MKKADLATLVCWLLYGSPPSDGLCGVEARNRKDHVVATCTEPWGHDGAVHVDTHSGHTWTWPKW